MHAVVKYQHPTYRPEPTFTYLKDWHSLSSVVGAILHVYIGCFIIFARMIARITTPKIWIKL